ncbi:MAG: class I SAM-dependent methyltransferase [Salibacteraceae bacterium]
MAKFLTVEEKITFSFGKNWKNYLSTVDQQALEMAGKDIDHWLDGVSIEGKRVLDIGSGSGIHSLSFFSRGVKELVSFDYDKHSVEATLKMHETAGKPENWKIMQGSVLDRKFMEGLGQFDIVYSWGVLHHTGSMWEAIQNAVERVAPGGVFFISLYKEGPNYQKHLKLKQRYNASNKLGKKYLESIEILNVMLYRIRKGWNPFKWNMRKARGMTIYHDIVDWLGGLPYEVAHEDDVVRFMRNKGFELTRIFVKGEGGCTIFVFVSKNAG